MAEPAVHAWGHCLAVLRAAGPAEQAAVPALRRGGRSLTSVLAHARANSLSLAAGAAPPPVPDFEAPLDPAMDVVELAGLLAGSRPALERALIDLDARLDRGRLGRALGMAPGLAAARVSAVAQVWERLLDPALLAWLGPGECAELAGLLGVGVATSPAGGLADEPAGERAGRDGRDDIAGQFPGEALPRVWTLTELFALVGSVAEHADHCEICSDRRRAMVSVRGLQAQATLPPLPPSLRVAASSGGLRLPGPLPPPVDAAAARFGWLRRPTRWVAAGAAVVIAAGGAVGTVAWRADRSSGPPPATALAALPGSGNALTLTPAVVPADGLVTLRNTSSRRLSWQARPSAPWVEVNPASGTLGPGQAVQIGVQSLASAPPGGAHATVSIAGSDGSAAAADFIGPSGQQLDLAATSSGCLVRAQIVDDVEPVLVLHYRLAATDDHPVTMTSGKTGYVANLPALPDPLTWWVTASDSRGGSARSVDVVLAPGSCTAGTSG